MQGPEHEVARLGRGQGEPDGFKIAHLADKDDVRVLAQGGAQCFVEAECMPMDLALADETLLALVHEFDRVFDGKDVSLL